MSNAILEVKGLVKRFGGLTATDSVTLDVRPGEVHALIGPNGAGKSTLINQLCGELAPDEGQVFLAGTEVTAMDVPARVALGLGRTFQITNLLNDMTVRENIAMAVQARAGHNFRIWDVVRRRRKLWSEAEALLDGTPLEHRAHVPVAGLSHGEKKQLELLVALARKPQILLLDEPMAGLGHAESQEMVIRLRDVAQTMPMLLVEHDMEAVFALATRISVLVYGRIIATGTVDEIRTNAEVREAYLGAEDELC
ncbi:amino acid/amide ABC transporter ATP-binding protein 1, HAAT family [Gemmobacter megaterium]|uniref:Amino acid/amide ABC transporter ATP-binding protein 1, HAAT family n=1 Tax=Gemmobacter megaterium TaxID=1086013 RepID=A0A1N7QDE6_9RHOB|nr:ABC transporter ATP-binding protein [Gemmobacter megaterium]GGE25089.1 ABC transporter ATP-binding protein [Gemmobacter megaterium]SIT20893.1 amino acid/amide ABC transporter ATP-binding protein 1, HAAT family [Gemmobacter megaterium]